MNDHIRWISPINISRVHMLHTHTQVLQVNDHVRLRLTGGNDVFVAEEETAQVCELQLPLAASTALGNSVCPVTNHTVIGVVGMISLVNMTYKVTRKTTICRGDSRDTNG